MSIARRWIVFLLICSYFSFAGAQQEPIKLWPKGAPGAEGSVTPETVRLNPDGEHIISNIQEPVDHSISSLQGPGHGSRGNRRARRRP